MRAFYLLAMAWAFLAGLLPTQTWAGSPTSPMMTATIGDFVWRDLDSDGIQDGGEPGLANVYVELQTSAGGWVNAVFSNSNGAYSFTGVAPGSYKIKFANPGGFFQSPQSAPGSTAANDNDADLNGFTAVFSVAAGQVISNIDAGFKPTNANTCSLTLAGAVGTKICNDNGTPANPADDVYSFSFTGSLTANPNNLPTWGFKLQINNQTFYGMYGMALNIGPIPISAGNLTWTLVDDDNPTCFISGTVTPPNSCSPGGTCPVSASRTISNTPINCGAPANTYGFWFANLNANLSAEWVWDQGNFIENSNGTAMLIGVISNKNLPTAKLAVDINFSGRTFSAPAGSPKTDGACAGTSATGWYFYTSVSGHLTGLNEPTANELAGASLMLSGFGAKPQFGTGASLRNSSANGGSSWLNYTISMQPVNMALQLLPNPAGQQGADFNIQLSGSPLTNCQPPVCDDVTSPGSIGNDEAACPPFDPSNIIQLTAPAGGSGALEYVWLASTTGCPTASTQQVPGATGATYDPGVISQTTWYIRCVRRVGCTTYTGNAHESNCVKKEVKTTGCNPCSDVTSGGQIGSDESACPPFNPAAITQTVAPTGGTGAFEYIWLSSTSGCPTNISQQIAGATSASYDPGQISQTTWYVRCTRRAGCTVWGPNNESNCVKKEVKTIGCGGGTPNCSLISIDPGSGNIVITGLSAPVIMVQAFNAAWVQIFNETYSAPNPVGGSVTISGLAPGNYYVKVNFLTAQWGAICEKDGYFPVGGNPTCSDVTSGGQIGSNETGCPNFNPTNIVQTVAPAGGTGAFEYIWLSSTTGCPTSISQQIAGATGISYDPGPISATTWFVRCTRRAGCTVWGPNNESNCVKKEVSNVGCNPCSDVTSGGQIGSNETGCPNFNPTNIVQTVAPAGGTGAFEYIWLSSTTGCPTSISQQIAGATGISYDPGPISATTWFVRCTRRAGCTVWGPNNESNCVKKEVSNVGCTTLTMTCTANITVTAAAGQTTAVVNYTAPTATSTCTTGSISIVKTSGLASGSVFPTGTSTVVYQATDGCGNVKTCSFTVTVNPGGGGTPDCSLVTITGGANDIVIGGLTAPIIMIQAFNAAWMQVFNQTYSNSPGTVTIPGLANGVYYVKVDFLNAAWQPICMKDATVPVPGGGGNCTLTLDFSTANKICHNNGTTNTGTDDTWTVDFTAVVTANPLGLPTWGWTATINGATVTGMYNMVKNLGPFPISAGNLTFTYTDDDNPTCTKSVTIAPPPSCSVPPTGVLTFNCTNNIQAGAAAGQSYAIVNYTPPTATSTCTVGTVSVTKQLGPASGSQFPVGVTTVCYEATDGCGNTKTCCFTVTVNAPSTGVLTMVCTNNISVTAAVGQTSAIVNYTAPTATSTCAVGTVSVVKTSGLASGSAFPVGTSTVVYTATDGCGNVKTCSFTITVNAAPPTTLTLTCPVDMSITAAVGATTAIVTYPTPTATTTCAGGAVTIIRTVGPASGSAFPVGTTQVCHQATDNCGQVKTCCFTVTVNPGTPADCDVKSDGCVTVALQSITTNANGSKTYAFKVTNNCPMGLSNAAFQLPGGFVATAPGNNYTGPSGQNYSVENPTSNPFYSIKFNTTGPNGINNGAMDVFTFTLPAGAGMLPAISVTIKESTTEHTVSLSTANCGGGNSGVLTMVCTNNITATAAVGQTSAIVNYTAPTATSTCPIGTVSISRTSGLASGSAFPVGVSTVVYQATDGCGNVKTCSFTVTVNPGQPVCNDVTSGGQIGSNETGCPGFNPTNIVETVAPAGGSGAFEYIWLSSTTACPTSISQQIAGATGISYDPGPITVTTWFVRCTRRAGCTVWGPNNESNCVKKDVSNNGCGVLAFNCTANSSINATGPNGATLTWTDPTATTTCGVGSVTVTQTGGPAKGTTQAAGVYTITYQATDGCGNVKTCSFTVEVKNPACLAWATRTISNTPQVCTTPGGSQYGFWFVGLSGGLSSQFWLWESGTMTENGDGTATITGVLKNFAKATAKFNVAITLSGRTFTAPAMSPKVDDACAGTNASGWYYYTTLTGTMTGTGDLAGGSISLTKYGPAVQLGNGASLRHSTANGISSWLGYSIGSQPTNGTYHFNNCAANTNCADINAQLSGNPLTNCAAPPCNKNILFVVGNTTLNTGDAAIKAKLESKGFILTIKSASSSTSADATGKALVIISSTVNSGDVNTKFKHVAVPVLLWESQLYDDMCMASTSYGSHPRPNNASFDCKVVSGYGSHPIASGLGTDIKCFSNYQDVSYGVPCGINTAQLAFLSDLYYDNTKCGVYAYDKGKTMCGSFTSPDKRIAFCLDNDAATDLTADGWKLFLNCVYWATGCPNVGYYQASNSTLTFDAYRKNFDVQLKWLNNTGEKNDFFDIERSADGVHFSKIARVEGEGPKGDQLYFQAFDREPLVGDNIYRLKMVWHNGTVTYTDEKLVHFESIPAIALFPNPTDDEVKLDIAQFAGEQVTIRIFNQLGKQVFTQELAEAPVEPVKLDLTAFASGQYTVFIENEHARPTAKKLVITRL